MPQLSEVSYSRDACITAVRDYYGFLTKLYLKESVIIEPPEGGWPTITTDSLRGLGKTDEVVSLLRYLPYMSNYYRSEAEGFPQCTFADWQSHGCSMGLGRSSSEGIKIITESASFYENIPSHVIGLTSGGRENPVFLLDTELGVIYWPGCNGQIQENPIREPIVDDAYDYAAENEAEWRAEGAAWAIADFFEVLKDQFQRLQFVPLGPQRVLSVYMGMPAYSERMLPMLQEIYRAYGWPDLERYLKQECLEAVQTALEEIYPGW